MPSAFSDVLLTLERLAVRFVYTMPALRAVCSVCLNVISVHLCKGGGHWLTSFRDGGSHMLHMLLTVIHAQRHRCGGQTGRAHVYSSYTTRGHYVSLAMLLLGKGGWDVGFQGLTLHLWTGAVEHHVEDVEASFVGRLSHGSRLLQQV